MARRRTRTRRQDTYNRTFTWVAVVLVIFVALLLWYVLTVLSDKTDTINSTTAEANATSANALSDESTDTSLVPNDDRTLLTPNNINDHRVTAEGQPICDAAFVQTAADQTVNYINEQYGFNVELPYNPDWGSADYRIAPFDELSEPAHLSDSYIALASTQYGPLSIGEGCGWYRFLTVHVRESRSFEQITEAEGGPFTNVAPRESTAGQHATVEYDNNLLCGAPTIEVIGSEYNLVFSHACPGQGKTEDTFSALRKTIETLEFK